MPRLIALLTDYGHSDAYVGIVKGVIHRICPEARIVDLSHDVPPQSIRAACHMLSVSRAYFPEQTVFLAVVDPGVGTSRQPVAVRTDRHFFVAPDNGILSFLKPQEIREIRALKERSYFLKPVSATFHGRDIFAPVAAHLASGADVKDLGPALKKLIRIPIPDPERRGKAIHGIVVWIDRFGNIVTNIPRDWLPGSPDVRIGQQSIRGLSMTYGEHRKGTLIALVGSGDRLEVSLVEGNAAGALGISVGDAVEVR